jgi:hypothetical protein
MPWRPCHLKVDVDGNAALGPYQAGNWQCSDSEVDLEAWYARDELHLLEGV